MAGLRASPNRASAVFRRAILSAYWDSLLGDPIERGLASTSRGKREDSLALRGSQRGYRLRVSAASSGSDGLPAIAEES